MDDPRSTTALEPSGIGENVALARDSEVAGGSKSPKQTARVRVITMAMQQQPIRYILQFVELFTFSAGSGFNSMFCGTCNEFPLKWLGVSNSSSCVGTDVVATLGGVVTLVFGTELLIICSTSLKGVGIRFVGCNHCLVWEAAWK